MPSLSIRLKKAKIHSHPVVHDFRLYSKGLPRYIDTSRTHLNRVLVKREDIPEREEEVEEYGWFNKEKALPISKIDKLFNTILKPYIITLSEARDRLTRQEEEIRRREKDIKFKGRMLQKVEQRLGNTRS